MAPEKPRFLGSVSEVTWSGGVSQTPRSVSAGGAAVQTRGLACSQGVVELHDLVVTALCTSFPVDWLPVFREGANQSVIFGKRSEANLN